MTQLRKMTLEEEISLRDQFRHARGEALRDAEGFGQVFFALERFGVVLNGGGTLGRLEGPFAEFVKRSALSYDLPSVHPEYHPAFRDLYDKVRHGRNDAAHEGVSARNLTAKAVELGLIFEDALQARAMKIESFMVREPVTASLWEPLSFIRQKMLMHSFSFLPVHAGDEGWRLISDRALAKVLRSEDEQSRRSRMKVRLRDAVAKGILELESVRLFEPEHDVGEVVREIGDRPVLVVSGGQPDRLLGIVTAFDLL